MILIFGGAFQGKKEYVINKYKVPETQFFDCENPVICRDSEDRQGVADGTCAAADEDGAGFPEEAADCRVIDHLEAWILSRIEPETGESENGPREESGDHGGPDGQNRARQDAVSVLRRVIASGNWENKIVICTDITRGVVPADAVMRKWRDQTGRCLQLLAEAADTVVQVFCGMGECVKQERRPDGLR